MKEMTKVLAAAALALAPGAYAGEFERVADQARELPAVREVLKEAQAAPAAPLAGRAVETKEAAAQGRDPWSRFPVSSLQAVVDACVAAKPPVEDVSEFMKVYGKCLKNGWHPLYIERIWEDDWRDGLMIQCDRRASQDAVEKANGIITVPGKRASGLLRIIVDARREEDRGGRDR